MFRKVLIARRTGPWFAELFENSANVDIAHCCRHTYMESARYLIGEVDMMPSMTSVAAFYYRGQSADDVCDVAVMQVMRHGHDASHCLLGVFTVVDDDRNAYPLT